MPEIIGLMLKKLRAERKMSQRRLAELSGVNRSYINQIEHGKVKSITLNTAKKFADALNVPPSAFFGEPESRIDIQKIPGGIVRVPIYDDFPVHAGHPVSPMDYCYVAEVSSARKSLEGYRVSGDCLSPSIQDGDIVIVDRQGDIDSGDLALCYIEGEVHLGRFRKFGGDYFFENNHSRFRLDPKDAPIMAPVIQVVRRLK